ncbi:MAG TPA: PQQ-binding-like beta-propeller repeat protein [Roseimicrobium sp.]|nr:PQQ-binding-like beta-propeller repeat protein [Roseimicrobium sp.]
MNAYRHLTTSALMLASIASGLHAQDWNQWRGPQRNGVAGKSIPLASSWTAEGPKSLWESESIPSADDGGLGSVVTWNGKAYLSVVWHSDVPSETRTIDDLVMRKLGYQNPSSLGKELVAKMEADREALSPQLRGKKLDEYIDTWVGANLDKKQKQLFSGFVGGRFRKGKLAIPLDDFEKMNKMVDKPFATQAEFEKWVGEQGFADHVKQQVIEGVPPTMRVAEDVVVCLDLASGKTLWKSKAPGEPKGRNCSSTPAVVDGKVYALGSTHVYCVDATSGKQLWATPLPAKAPGSSPLVVENTVIVNSGRIAAYNATTGAKLWEQPKAGGANASPVAWTSGGKTLALCNGRNDIAALDLKTGDVVWSAPAGGDSTPAILGDILTIQARNAKLGLVAYQLSLTDAKQLWSFPFDALRTQSSPLIHNGHVFLMDDNVQYCVKLADGKLAWQAAVPASISSPVIADDKIFVMINSGNNVQVLKASGEERVELGKANLRATWCPSPAITDGRLIVRTKDRVRCYDIASNTKPAPIP